MHKFSTVSAGLNDNTCIVLKILELFSLFIYMSMFWFWCVLFSYFRDVPIDVPDKYGFTGLMQASQKGYTEYVSHVPRGYIPFVC